jgi:hypothetical protein
MTRDYTDDILRSMREFFDMPNLTQSEAVSGVQESVGFYNEWFMYDFILRKDMSVLKHFVQTNPLKVSSEELAVYEDMLDNRFGLFEIISITPLQSMCLKLVAIGEIFTVIEYAATMEAQVGWGIFARVARVGDHYEMVGADGMTVPLQDPNFKPYKDQILALSKLTPKNIHVMLTTGEVV